MHLKTAAHPRFFLLVCAALSFFASDGRAQDPFDTFTTLHRLTDADGATISSVIQDTDGSFYGTTVNTVFRFTTDGTLTTLHTFTGNDGSNVNGKLLKASDGSFYGTTSQGGTNNLGTIFKITTGPDSKVTTVFSFDSTTGGYPLAGLSQDSAGNFYCPLSIGGSQGDGTLFRLPVKTPPPHTFGLGDDNGNPDGSQPTATLTLGSDGNFYGSTTVDGSGSNGTIFQFVPPGGLQVIHEFSADNGTADFGSTNADGHDPLPLVQAGDGTFYGAARKGGANGCGTIFRLGSSGGFTVLTNLFQAQPDPMTGLSGPGEANPSSFILASNGKFYGTSPQGGDGYGSVFVFTTGDGLSELHLFENSDGAVPAGLVQGIDGNIYGVTSLGSENDNGTIFKLGTVPNITSSATLAATQGQTFSYQITATDSPTKFGAQGLPAGFTVDAGTGIISGTPAAAGTIKLTLHATNATGKGTGPLTINVAPAPPVITSATTASGTTGATFSYQITATNKPTSFGVQGLPGGLSVNASTGVISGTPKTTGKFTLTINAYNGGGKGSATLTLTITVPEPVITSATMARGKVGVAFSYQITATHSPTSYGVQGLPGGLSVNATTGVISGSPKTAGTYSLTVNAYNGGGKGSATVTLKIENALPVITSATTASGKVGTAFSYQITASGDPTSYGVQGLPAGLSVNASTGVISGTPTKAGTSTLTLNAYNNAGKGSATLTLTVNAK